MKKYLLLYLPFILTVILFDLGCKDDGIGHNRCTCLNNVKQIYLSIKMYKDAFNNEYPSSLYDLCKEGYLENPSVYCCPKDFCDQRRQNVPNTFINKRTFVTDYIYSAPSDNKIVPILWDMKDNHHNCGHVLYSDGTVKEFEGNNWYNKYNSN